MQSLQSVGPAVEPLGEGREAALRASATAYGVREGWRLQSCRVRAEIERQQTELDRRFRFADLMMGAGILPPVISETQDSVSLEETVMRIASRVYRIEQNARVVAVPPTWRDWLHLGLSADPCGAQPAELPALQQRPQTPREAAFFRAVLERSYESGLQQARQALVQNLARLEHSYAGMRRYFDLYARGMVSAPVIATATDIASRGDPNTLLVGNTVIRITAPVSFVDKPQKWRPLGE